MQLEKKISRACKQAAVVRYVSVSNGSLVPLPPGQRLQRGQVVRLIIDQN